MQALAAMPSAVAAAVRVVLTDIDDTLTTDGRLPADAYAALERLEQAGIRWCPSPAARPAGATTSPACGRCAPWSARTGPSTMPTTARPAA